jgi:hypothetical protein
MGVIVSLRGRKALFRNGQWRSAHPALEARLNRLTEQWIQATGGPAIGSSDPERDTVKEIARQAGARVLLHAPANPRREFRVYLSRRQMRFPFDE